jgi:uncharacterized glyoxalase superfamily protein PhnB
MSSKTLAVVVPILPVRDLTQAIEFYHCLGFTSRRWRDGDIYAFTHRDGHELHLSKTPDLDPEKNRVRVYLYLHDGTAAALEAEFRAAGISIHDPLAPREWKMNEFALRDPDGNHLIFGEPIPSPEDKR